MGKLRLTNEQISARMRAFETVTQRAGRITCDTPHQAEEIKRVISQIQEFAIAWADQQLSREPLIV